MSEELKQAAQQALEALTTLHNVYTAMRQTLHEKYPEDGWSAETMTLDQARAAIDALEDALTAAQSAQEVAAVNTREQTFQNGYRIGYQAGRASLPTQPAAQPVPMTWPKARDIGRFGDMHPADHLRVGLDSDNDVYVSVWGEKGGASVEFCNPGGGGGGSSKRTREALIALMVAMEADNADRPDKDWWARRTAQAKGADHV